jgi:hypothetical protein
VDFQPDDGGEFSLFERLSSHYPGFACGWLKANGTAIAPGSVGRRPTDGQPSADHTVLPSSCDSPVWLPSADSSSTC